MFRRPSFAFLYITCFRLVSIKPFFIILTDLFQVILYCFAASLADVEEKSDGLREALGAIDVDALSPREALDQLYALKAQLEQE